MDSNHDIVPTLRMFDGLIMGRAADEIERLREALLLIECEPINAEYIARAALDGPKPKLQDCPHAAPFRYCPQCVENPCPIGLDKVPNSNSTT